MRPDASGGARPLPDLSDCAREPIEVPGRVQAFGCLLAISSDWVIQIASANAGSVLGLPAAGLVGSRLTDHLAAEAVHELRGKVQVLGGADDGARAFGLDLLGRGGAPFDVAIHRSGGAYVLEFEPKPPGAPRDAMSLVQPLLARVRRATTLEDMARAAARGVQALTGFARVMVYRLEPDAHGVVIAESLRDGAASYLGLHFPAADIPAQARELYRRSTLRIIPDVDAPTAALHPERHPEGGLVDLSLAVTRAVSPVHLEYLRNMGVAASLSASLLRGGALWGLVACHHPTPRHVDFETRSAVELLARLVSYEIQLLEARLEEERVGRAHELHERLVMMSEAGLDLEDGLGEVAAEIGAVLAFDGIAVHEGERFRAEGLAPTEAEAREVVRQLGRASQGRVFATDRLAEALPGAVAPGRGIAGLLALPLRDRSRGAARQVLLLFRREVAQNVAWAGHPSKVEVEGGRISPRRSFAAWREEVRGRALPWSAAERRAAEVLRVTLLELALKAASDLNARGQRRSERQEVLISELNHRLRNVFGLVGGLVGQVEPEGEEARALAAELGGRVRALARANDRLTRAPGARVRLSELLGDEVAAFAGGAFAGAASRVEMTGGDLRLPAALGGTLSLVIHELVTNAVKHGALSGPAGRVRVAVSAAPGGVAWTWEERGGPPAAPPARVGFGSTLIARAIPHARGGEAEVSYPPEGLRARFVLPARHAELVPAEAAALAPEARPARAPGAPACRIPGTALVVEDNVVIALNAADALRALGAAEVLVAGSNREAIGLLAAHPVACAVLDMDLGGETSAATAAALAERGVPFLLATGYDPEAAAREAGLPVGRVLTKPYSTDGIAAALAPLLAAAPPKAPPDAPPDAPPGGS